jgi:hydrogenase expression/formation protein HypE
VSDDTVKLEHGAGGRAMRELIETRLVPVLGEVEFEGIGLGSMDDGAAIRVGDRWLVLTTDSHVVQPSFFPGGDIGRLAMCGTINDLAVMGATAPTAVTCALVVEEGFPLASLDRVYASIADVSREVGVPVVAGDTKVMGRGELDGIALTTTGFGWADTWVVDANLYEGDRIIVSGTIGDHGMAVMAARNELALEGDLASDVAPVNRLVARALEAGGEDVVVMKDPTRGGLSAVLHELAAKSRVGLVIEEARIPVRDPVRSACELLGIDPLVVANEGKVVFGVRERSAERVLTALREDTLGENAEAIGFAAADQPGKVVLDTGFGRRMLSEPSGEPLPRIC